MGRGRTTCWPPAAPVVLLLLLVVGFSHCVAAARLLPLQPADDGLVVQGGEAAGKGNGAGELSSISEMMGGGGEEEAGAAACAEDSNDDDECMERRLLGDAHLDYIYTQHKGKP